jgi:hypothetical protein
MVISSLIKLVSNVRTAHAENVISIILKYVQNVMMINYSKLVNVSIHVMKAFSKKAATVKNVKIIVKSVQMSSAALNAKMNSSKKVTNVLEIVEMDSLG